MHSSTARCTSLHAASVACALVALSVLAPTTAHATPLGLNSTHPGDVKSSYTQVDYVLNGDGTGTLTAVGYPEQFDDPATPNNQNFLFDSLDLFSLTMVVNQSNGSLVSGTLEMDGNSDGGPLSVPTFNGTLLTGTIIQFGFQDPGAGYTINGPAFGNTLEFVVHVTGGVLAPGYYGTQTAGILLHMEYHAGDPNPFVGLFTQVFSNNGNGYSDTFPTDNPNVPEPSTFALLGLGLIGLAWRLRRRSRLV